MWNRQELQIENAKQAAQMGIISFDEAFQVFRALRDKNDAIIKELYARRIDGNKDRAVECSGA